MPKTKYSFEDYNEFNVLKIPLLLSLLNGYMLKQIVILGLLFVSSIPFLNQFAHEHFSIVLLLSSIPAILVIASASKRIPKTRSPLIKKIWRWGRFLLLSSLGLEIGFIILYVTLGIQKLNEVNLMFLYIDVVFIIYLIKSQRVRDVFTEFPEKE
jgi:magnesium-transporting ATPase (P-type)